MVLKRRQVDAFGTSEVKFFKETETRDGKIVETRHLAEALAWHIH